MPGRLPHAAAALVAALLAAAAARIVHAERAFEAGLARGGDTELGPAADVEGRLADYEEAMRRDAGQALYALRAGQIRMRRAAGAASPADRSRELVAARACLDAAARALPIDPTVHATLAQVERMERDTEAALAEAALAVRLGPRSKGPLAVALAIGIAAYRDAGAVEGLSLALRASACFVEMEPFMLRGAGGALAAAFRDAGPELTADLLEATSADPALRRLAVRIARESRPEVADALESFSSGAEPAK